jgi:flagellar P-ring protein precursor FlgI
MTKGMFLRILTVFLVIASFAFSQTIKDISQVVGIRDNQLLGYGLVVGLNGTGDKSKFTMQSLQNLLRNSYIKIPTSSIQSKNIAAVMVTADLPPFSKQGDKIKIKISAIGDAKSIDRGELLVTQLKGVDGNVYALAQGSVISEKVSPTTGFIYDGATIENSVKYDLANENEMTISLLKNSAQNADLIETKINETFKENIAKAIDTKTIIVKKPENVSMVKLISIVENLPVESKIKKKIIIDLKRETIIAGDNIVVQPVTVSRAGYTIRIKQKKLNDADWKNPTINKGKDIGDNVVVADENVINVNNAMINTKDLPTVSDLMRAMKTMKLSITDIVETIKMIKDLGAIDVELEIRG